MPRLLFIAHGMGANPPGWSHSIVDKLDEVTARYDKFTGEDKAFSSRVRVEEICYDPIFDKYILQWAKSLDELRAFAKNNTIDLGRTLTLLTDGTLPQDRNNVFWTTLIDPLFWRGSPIVRDDVTATVMAQVARGVAQHLDTLADGETLDVSVMSHSLGTTVMHDALAHLGAEPFEGNTSLTSAKFQFDNFFTVANVSLLGPPPLVHINPYTSVVRPKTAPPLASNLDPYCVRFYNFRHEFDPFAQWQPFKPTGWGKNFIVPSGINHVHDVNVHGYTHYLDHPVVNAAIINRMIDLQAVPDSELKTKLAAYPRLAPPACNTAYTIMLKAFTAICNTNFSSPGNLDEIIANGVAFYQAAKQGVDDCHGLVSSIPGLV